MTDASITAAAVICIPKLIDRVQHSNDPDARELADRVAQAIKQPDRRVGAALQELSMAQRLGSTSNTAKAARSPLQDVLIAQPAVLIGLIAHIVGTPLQDDIVRTTDRLLRLGQDILATSAARAATPVPDCGAGRDRLRDVRQDSRLP